MECLSPKTKCVACGRGMPPLKKLGRFTAYDKPDWLERKMHKKCYKEEERYQSIIRSFSHGAKSLLP